MKLQDIVISRYSESKYDDISITIRVKGMDISPESRTALKAAWREGTLLNAELLLEEPPVIKGTLKGKGSVYQWFKLQCKELGADYEEEKLLLGVEHLVDLEKTKPLAEIDSLLRERISELKEGLGMYSNEL